MYVYTYIYIYTFLFPTMTFAPFHGVLNIAIFRNGVRVPFTTSWQVRVTTSNRVFMRRCRMSPIRGLWGVSWRNVINVICKKNIA